MNFKELVVIRILLLIAQYLAKDSEHMLHEIKSLSTHIQVNGGKSSDKPAD